MVSYLKLKKKWEPYSASNLTELRDVAAAELPG